MRAQKTNLLYSYPHFLATCLSIRCHFFTFFVSLSLPVKIVATIQHPMRVEVVLSSGRSQTVPGEVFILRDSKEFRRHGKCSCGLK